MDIEKNSEQSVSPIEANPVLDHLKSETAKNSSVSSYTKWMDGLKNRKVVTVVMAFSAGVAFCAALVDNLEKLWSRASSIFAPEETTRTLHGRLHEFSDTQKPVTAASVMLGLSNTVTSLTDKKGEFTFVVPASELGSRVLLSVRAEGYAPFDFPRLQLNSPFERLDIPLSPLVNPGHKFGEGDVSIQHATTSATTDGDPIDFHSFEFIYTYDPPGPRRWTRIDDRLWIEVYGDNRLSFFPVLEAATIDGCKGTIVAKSPISSLDNSHRTISFNKDATVQQVFIPGRSCTPLWLRFRHPQEREWRWLQQMTNVK